MNLNNHKFSKLEFLCFSRFLMLSQYIAVNAILKHFLQRDLILYDNKRIFFAKQDF